MSKQNVLDFDLRIRGDKDLQSRVKALPSKDAEGLVKLGAECGFNFSVSELLAVIGPSHNAEELSDADLEHVAGSALNAYAYLPPESFISVKWQPTEEKHRKESG